MDRENGVLYVFSYFSLGLFALGASMMVVFLGYTGLGAALVAFTTFGLIEAFVVLFYSGEQPPESLGIREPEALGI